MEKRKMTNNSILSIQSTRYEMEPMRVLAFGDVPAAYDVSTGAGALSVPAGAPNHELETASLYPARQWILQNNTNAYLYYSTNGIDDNGSLNIGQGFVNDMCSNKTSLARGAEALLLPANTTIYIRYPIAAPTSGEVTLSLAYGGV